MLLVKRHFLLVVVVTLFLSACTVDDPGSPYTSESATQQLHNEETKPVRRTAVVRFDENTGEAVARALSDGTALTKAGPIASGVEELSILSIERVFPEAGEWEPRTRDAGLHLFYEVVYDAPVSKTKAGEVLSQIPGVLEVEHQLSPRLCAFNDPYFSRQWHLYNRGMNGYRLGADVNVVQAWEDFTTGNSSVIVEVVDQGVLMNHVDLAGNLVPSGSDGSYNFTTNTGNIVAGSHGTHVAGIISAVNNNGRGVCGIAGGDFHAGRGGVKILSAQVFGARDEDPNATSSGLANAIKWGADHGAVIFQNSWGYSPDDNDDGIITDDELTNYKRLSIPSSLRGAVDYAIKYAGCDQQGNQLPGSPMKGGLVLFAAGNDEIDYNIICSYEPVVAVGAFGPTGERAYYSNYGPWVDLAAPGGDVYAPFESSANQILSLTLNNNYGYMQGTSMACPAASGVAALIVSAFGGQGFTCNDLREALLGGADVTFFEDNSVIGPKIDAYGSMSYFASEAPAAPGTPSVELSSSINNSLSVGGVITADEQGFAATGVRVLYSKDRSELEAVTAPGTLRSGFCDFNFPEGVKAGDRYTVELRNLEFETTYYVAVAMYSKGRKCSPVSGTASAKTGENLPPVIEVGKVGAMVFKESDTVLIPLRITDPEGQKISVSLLTGGKAYVVPGEEECVWTFNLYCPSQGPGSFSATLKAVDPQGKAAEVDMSYTVLKNNPPVLSSPIPSFVMDGFGTTRGVDLKEHFSDPDGDELVFMPSCNSSIINHRISNNGVLTINSTGYGAVVFTISASDRMASVSSTFQVLVRQTGSNLEVYPNPCGVVLYVRPGEEERPTHVVVVSQTGTVVADVSAQASAFEPLEVDMSGAPVGVYTVKVDYGQDHYQEVVVKK